MNRLSRRAFMLTASAACVSAGSRPARPAEPGLLPLRIEVPSAENLQFLTLWVALGSDAFARHGLAPKILVAPSPRQTGDALLRGDAEITVLPPPMFLGMMAEDKPIRLFASLLANEPINLVVRKEIAAQRNFRTGAGLREKLAALRGLRTGLAPEVAPRLRAIYAAAGLNADRELMFVTIPGPQQVQALADAKIDMLFAHTPYLETALVRYGAVLAVNASDGEIAGLANGQIHALAATRDIVAHHRDLVQRATAAIADAESVIHTGSDGGLNALLKYRGNGLDRQLARATMAVYSPAVPQTPRISIAGILRDRNIYPAHPRAPDFSIVRAADFVDNSFADAVRTGN